MLNRFNGPVMNDICTLDANFAHEADATKFFRHFIRLKRVKGHIDHFLLHALPDEVHFNPNPTRCSYQACYGFLELGPGRRNPMEVLHILAHYLQPADTPWHGGEFGKIFLDLIDRRYGPETKRQAKDIMVANKIKTSTRSQETREKQTTAFYKRRLERAPEGLRNILKKLDEIDAHRKGNQ